MDNRREILILLTLALIQFTHVVDFMMMMPLSHMFIDMWKLESIDFNILVSSYAFSAFISSLISVTFMNRYSRKRILSVVYFGFIISTAACGLADSYETLMIARCAAGLFGGVLSATILTLVGDVVPNERRARGMGVVMAGFSVAAALGVPLGLELARNFTWQTPFYSLAGFALFVFLIAIILIPNVTSNLTRGQSIGSVFGETFHDKNQRRALLLTILIVLGQFTVIPTINQFLIKNLHFPENRITLLYVFGGAATIFTGPLVGRLADKYGRYRLFSIMLILSLGPLLIFTHMEIETVWVILLVSTMMFITINGRMVPTMTMISSAAHQRNRGSFMSINSSTMQLASSAAPIISGLILLNTQEGLVLRYNVVGYVAIAFSLIALVVARGIKIADE